MLEFGVSLALFFVGVFWFVFVGLFLVFVFVGFFFFVTNFEVTQFLKNFVQAS